MSEVTPTTLELAIELHAPPSRVWSALTEPAQMITWMGEPELGLQIETSWREGSSIEIRGTHHLRFVNRGIVVHYQPPTRLIYTHLSSLSRLPDAPESYARFDFALEALSDGTALTLRLGGFATSAIEKHLAFYWRGTLPRLKLWLETGTTAPAAP